MSQYICSICGYVYNEEDEGVSFNSLPESWRCPLCGATKDMFSLKDEKKETEQKAVSQKKSIESTIANDEKEFTNAEMYILLTNLAKSCEKQYMSEEADLFLKVSEYYKNHSEIINDNNLDSLINKVNNDLTLFDIAFENARNDEDRGALRALTWSQKVTKTLKSLLERFQKEGKSFLEDNKIYVCEICGFIFIGKEKPAICPVCKVPNLKIHEIGR